MTFDKTQFTEYNYSNEYGEQSLFFDFDITAIHKKYSTTKFEYHKTLLKFLKENPTKNIYLTKEKLEEKGFQEIDDNIYLINFDEFQRFCEKLDNREDRANAFFRQEVSLKNIKLSAKQIKQYNTTAIEEEIIERIKKFTNEQKQKFIMTLRDIEGIELEERNLGDISHEEFSNAFLTFLKDPKKQEIIIANYLHVQVQTLESHKQFLENNLDKEETIIQNWIDGEIDNEGNPSMLSDEEKKKIKKSRCLIFGLEFIDHKREGQISSKRFDVLTKLSEDRNEYVLIELKSPDAEVFKIHTKTNTNEGKSTEYHLSPDISRAIPQILRYKDNLESKSENDDDWQRIGVPKGKIAKCLIFIGTRKKGDPVWESHFSSIKRNFSNSLDIVTYTDLIEKLDTTIKNLKTNL